MFRLRHTAPRVCSRLVRALAALTMLALGARAEAAPVALSAPIDLEWDAPPECPGRETVLAQIDRLVGDAPPGLSRDHPSARVSVSRGLDGRWHVQIVILGEPEGVRTLDSASCSALTGAAALVLAIRIKPNLLNATGVHPGALAQASEADAIPPPPPPAAPTPLPMPGPLLLAPDAEVATSAPARIPPPPVTRDVPAARSPHRGSLSVGASVLAATGELPSFEGSAELELGYEVRGFRIELHSETGLVDDVLVRGGTGSPGATFRAAGGGVRGSYGPSFGALAFFGGGDCEVDAVWANGQGFARSFGPKTAWVTLGALVGARYRVATRLAIHAFGEGLLPMERPTFTTVTSTGEQDRVVHKPSAVWGQVGVGVDAIFF